MCIGKDVKIHIVANKSNYSDNSPYQISGSNIAFLLFPLNKIIPKVDFMNELVCKGKEQHAVELDNTASLAKHTVFYY